MTMKKQALKLFVACCIFNMLIFPSSFAQIIYTDVIPDAVISTNGAGYFLDLNNDGIQDFNITYSTSLISGFCSGSTLSTKIDINITPLSTNEVGHASSYPSTYPASLISNSIIDETIFSWQSNPGQTLETKSWHCVTIYRNLKRWVTYYSGSWYNATSKYLPLRLHVGLQVYYGWVRLTLPTGLASFTVLDYAYNSTPGQSIFSGEPMPMVNSLPTAAVCPGSSIGIPVFAQSAFNAGNNFIAQLSNLTGSLDNLV